MLFSPSRACWVIRKSTYFLPFPLLLLCYNGTMKRKLMEILACPICKGKLELTVDKEEGPEIVTGSLYCRRCNERYLIVDSIPNLLPLDQR